jgi:monoamine oxidase
MAHSTILKHIQAMVKNHAEAEKRRIPAEALLERKAEQQEKNGWVAHLSRRDFLANAMGLGVAAALPLPAFSRSAVQPRIAIIGGGLAGLCAALKLHDNGLAATIYEASRIRIGGRILTERGGPGFAWANSQITDAGAEYIDSDHYSMIKLAKRFGIPLIPHWKTWPQGAKMWQFANGARYYRAQANKDWAAFRDKVVEDLNSAPWPQTYNQSTAAGRLLDKMTTYDWIESRVPGGHTSAMGVLLDAAFTMEFGADSTQQSCLGLVYLLAYSQANTFQIFGSEEEMYTVEGGCERIIDAIADQIGHAYLLDRKLRKIKLRSDGTYRLYFESDNGGTYAATADYVILAYPFAAMKESLDFSEAGFDTLKKRTIKQLGAGHHAKLTTQFSSRFWNAAGNNGTTISDILQWTWDTTIGQAGSSGILVDYFGGDGALSALHANRLYQNSNSAEVVTDTHAFLSQLNRIFPGASSHWNGKSAISLMHKSPEARCSYSYYKPGNFTTIAGYEQVRQGNILFAGDQCDLDWQGYLEAAVKTGKKAATDIIREL